MQGLLQLVQSPLIATRPSRYCALSATAATVLVVDRHTTDIINCVVPLLDLYDENIATVEHVEDQRAGDANFEAIYFVTPRPHIVDCVIADFNRPKPLYAAAHLFFISALDDKLFDRLTASKAKPFLRCLTEIFVDFFPVESHLFSFRENHSFYTLYNPDCRSILDKEVARIANRLLSVCVTLGENPVIRHYRPLHVTRESKTISYKIAALLQAHLDEHVKLNEHWPPAGSRGRAVLFVLDRSVDPVAPLLHEFTFQAMVNDLLNIHDGKKYSYTLKGPNGPEEKTSVFDEKDKIWTDIRHLHMREAIDRLMADFNNFCAENTNFTAKDKATNLNDMRDMLAELPQFQETRDQFSLHLSMSQESMNLFEQKKLPVVGMFEQDCATGLDTNGKTPHGLVEQIIELLDDPALSQRDKLRLLMLHTTHRNGIIEDDLSKMIQHAGLSNIDTQILRNLDLLGVPTIKKWGDKSKRSPQKRNKSTEEDAYELSRFQPVLKSVLEDHIRGHLDVEMFPYIKEAPQENSGVVTGGSLRSARPTWAKSRTSTHEARPRMIVFMAGGAVYSESRACYDISKAHGRDVFFGSNEMLTPESFLHRLGKSRAPRASLNLPCDQPILRPAALTILPPPKHPEPSYKPPVLPQPASAASPPTLQSQNTGSSASSSKSKGLGFHRSKSKNGSVDANADGQDADKKKHKKFGLFK
ncbi:Protein transport protein sec1 [Neolecta irregularis DAH-3]|uniref:Protein transport protein sec1 n=1 Tax=Neolecta irregularis (strain DAH-3) TaxID=1198029 RepID=A0A1U7LK99_NEOID|nr:Protein transport protein sec1 [Neolecta irregularis DAH-3]|eukprot:OLL23058.1 Protein transport protein sec1 [Neolecta irregularis DAH-3]